MLIAVAAIIARNELNKMRKTGRRAGLPSAVDLDRSVALDLLV